MQTSSDKPLTVAISSTVLFDLTTSNDIYENQGLEEYRRYQIAQEDAVLAPGEGFFLVEKLLNINKLLDVPASMFTPIPKVDGTILEFIPHNDFIAIDINSIDEVSKSAFSQRRKKIKNNMINYIEIIEKLSIDQNLRPENLSVLDYCEVAKNI